MTQTLLFPLWCACFRVVLDGRILVPYPANKTCGQRYDRKAGNSPCCQLERSAKKPSKDDVKNLFWPWKLRPVTAVLLAFLRVLAYHFGREKSRQDLATVAAVFTGGDVGQLLPAYILIQARMHANSDTEV